MIFGSDNTGRNKHSTGDMHAVHRRQGQCAKVRVPLLWQHKQASGKHTCHSHGTLFLGNAVVMQHAGQGKDKEGRAGGGGPGSPWEALTMQSPRCSSCSGGHCQLANHKKSYKEAVVLLRYTGAHHIAMVIKPFLPGQAYPGPHSSSTTG